MFITDWRKGDPRFNDPNNPLYNLRADKRSDWRDSVSFGQFKDFLAYVREERDKKNGVAATKKLQRLTKELAQDQTDVEILEKLLKVYCLKQSIERESVVSAFFLCNIWLCHIQKFHLLVTQI